MNDLSTMIELAKKAMKNAYAPYSNFPVGAVIKSASGKFYIGCNVENAAYPSGSCAEQSAIAEMVVNGEKEIEAILVIGKGSAVVSPCGACRQRIREFANEKTILYLCGEEGLRETVTFFDILPMSFGPENLAKNNFK